MVDEDAQVTYSPPLSVVDKTFTYTFVDLSDIMSYTISMQVFDTATNDGSNQVAIGTYSPSKVSCFLKGTLILTGNKKTWVPIETLRIGDHIWSPSQKDSAKITKIFHQKYSQRTDVTMPFKICTSDRRFSVIEDVFISPLHAIYVKDRFMEALTIPGLQQSLPSDQEEIIYYNLELNGSLDPFKNTFCAGGLIAESWGNRTSLSENAV